MRQRHLFRLLIALFTSGFVSAYEEDYSCENTICSPKAGDLLIGRESALQASSTCGLDDVQPYCVVTAGGKSHCKECYSKQEYNKITNPNSHRIKNVISRVPSDPDRWWQSENAVHNVSIVLNLETQFQFISTIMRFKTFRPAAMYLERSDNFGQTWKPYAYFSNNCPRDFPDIPERPRRTLNDVTCTNVYSQLTPSEGGVVAFMAAPSEMHANLPLYSEERQNLSAITNLRMTFTRLNTLGDMELDDSSAIKRKYYYAMYEWNVWGRCSCFGHATRCRPKSPHELENMEKVYGVCECTHNTAGDNCERCADFYQNKPWRPATRESANACERCECNGHSNQCYFNPLLYLQSNNVSGGQCHACQHNTEGVHCEFCADGFYRYPGYGIDHPQTCQPCNCHGDGSIDPDKCQQYTDPQRNTVAGRCNCKENVGGDKCDRCRVGYWNFQASNPKGCEACRCHMLGTWENSGCDPMTGKCTCKRYVGGEYCDSCQPGFFNLTASPLGCQPCACSPFGSLGAECDRETGRCRCKQGFVGRDCGQVEDGYYIRPPELVVDQPRIPVDVPIESPASDGSYVIVLVIDPKQFGPGDRWTVTLEPKQLGSRCSNRKYTVEVTRDTSKIVLPEVCLEAGKKTFVTIFAEPRHFSPYASVIFADIILIPDEGDVGRVAEYCEQFRHLANQITQGEVDPARMPKQCEDYFRLPQIHWSETGTVTAPCECNVTGSVSAVCNKRTGQCPCKPGVVGRTCNQCEPFHYHFSASGCTACDCNPQGSVSRQCDLSTSQCPCREGIEGRQCDRCRDGYWDFPNCRKCECNGMSDTCDQLTGRCLACRDNTGGDRCETCVQGYYGDPLRGVPCRPCECPGGGVDHSEGCSMHPVAGVVCHCKPGYTGPRCSECAPNYFGNPTELGGSCKPCDCSGNLPPEGGCNQVTGECLVCLHNTEGPRCDQCKLGFWGNASLQMCQRCSCYHLGVVGGANAACDRTTGECNCLPNVLGPRCFECAPYHFNLTSGVGCESCACDPVGSLFPECHPVSGACTCKPDRSGRKCDQCQRTYFGDPQNGGGCKPCDCDRSGSLSEVCDPSSGQCQCRPGIAGRRCDRCDRGTTGTLPNCRPCGECWTNWDKAIDRVVVEMRRLENQTSNQLPPDLKPVFTAISNLVEQIELLPGSNLTNEKLNEFDEVLALLEQKVKNLDNLDTQTGELSKAISALDRLTKEQAGITSTLSESEEKLEALSALLDDMKNRSAQIAILDPHGAYAALLAAREEVSRLDDTQKSLQRRRVSLEAMRQSATMSVSKREAADEEFRKLTKQLEERIKDLQDEIRQLNRLICGDNGQVPDGSADRATCPSACGGTSCDPVVAEVLGIPEADPSLLSREQSFGVISRCASARGCDQSTEARIKGLLADHLALQNQLGTVLQSATRVSSLVSGVNSSRWEAEDILRDATERLTMLNSRLQHVHRLTDKSIDDARRAKELYENLTLERYEELSNRIRGLSHTADLAHAIRLGEQLQNLSARLHYEVQRIFAETADERNQANQLVDRAQRISDRAKSFLEQMNQLAEVKKLYDELEGSAVFRAFDGPEFQVNKQQLAHKVDTLVKDHEMISQDIRSAADRTNQNAQTAQRLLQDTEDAQRGTVTAEQSLQNLNSTFKQLNEKMGAINEAMKKMNGKNGSQNGSGSGGDPSGLAKHVEEYIEKLEASLKEIQDLRGPLEEMEQSTNDLTGKLQQVAKTFTSLTNQLSSHTKRQRFCS
nr:unnamed protein product [Spirometra erinaceieuropaei]